MASDTATFGINLEVNAASEAEKAAAALEGLRQRVASGTEAITRMSADLRRLRGSSAEVISAKNELKAKLDAERNAVSAANLAILKAGGSYDLLSAAAKKASSATDKAAAAAEKAKKSSDTFGLGIEDLTKQFGDLTKQFGGTAAGITTVVGVIGLVVGAAVAATTSIIGLAASFGRWVLESANAARSAQLVREAIAGSAENGRALGTQIDALAAKVPTAKAALQDLSVSLIKSRFQGQTLVDAFHAVGQASAALGDDVGNKLRGMLERGLTPFGREGFVFINPAELQGTGIALEDIAASLAKGTNRSVNDARMALVSGRVKLADAAKAMRDAVEKKFGDLNLRKMLDLDVLKQKFHETIATLTRGVNIEPILQGFQKFFDLFDPTKSVTGVAIKELVTLLGKGLVGSAETAGPVVVAMFKGMVIAALAVVIGVLRIRNALRSAFEDSAISAQLKRLTGDVDGLRIALDVGAATVGALAAAVTVAVANIAIGVGAILAPFVLVGAAMKSLSETTKSTFEKLGALDWGGIAKGIVSGLVSGLIGGIPGVESAIGALGKAAILKLKSTLGIASPSKVFAELGKQTPAGYAAGVEAAAPTAASAVEAMAMPPEGGAAGGGRSGGSVTVNVAIQVEGGGNAAGALSSESFLSGLTKAIEDALVGAGLAPA